MQTRDGSKLSAAQLADTLGLQIWWVYDNARALGGIKDGVGRWEFDADVARRAETRLRTAAPRVLP